MQGMEILDICDEQGRPTGQTVDRATAHRDGILHRTAHVWIVRERDGKMQILLQETDYLEQSGALREWETLCFHPVRSALDHTVRDSGIEAPQILDVVRCFADDRALIALMADGTVRSCGLEAHMDAALAAQFDALTDVRQVAYSSGGLIAVKNDGSVFSTLGESTYMSAPAAEFDPARWNDVERFYDASFEYYGLTRDGRVLVSNDNPDASFGGGLVYRSWTDVAQIVPYAYPEIPRGVAYNSYVLLDEKTVLVDTVDRSVTGQFFENLTAVLDGRELDYLVVNHMEPDHSSAISEVLVRYPKAQVVCTKAAAAILDQFFACDITDRAILVGEGDTLTVGKHTLSFVMAPMPAPSPPSAPRGASACRAAGR